MIQTLAIDSAFWFDNVWVNDSTPVECSRSRPTAPRSWPGRPVRLRVPRTATQREAMDLAILQHKEPEPLIRM